MKKTLIALITLLALGLGVYAWTLMNPSVPEPVVDTATGQILSDPANEARAPFMAPEPDSIKFE